MVTSRPTSDDQAMADFCTSTTPPSVTPDRKVMIGDQQHQGAAGDRALGDEARGVVRRAAERAEPVSAVASVIEHDLPVVELHAREGKLRAAAARGWRG